MSFLEGENALQKVFLIFLKKGVDIFEMFCYSKPCRSDNTNDARQSGA